MYHLYSKNDLKITHHYCNTLELAQVVKKYIEDKYPREIIIEKINDSFVYYDVPGPKCVNPKLKHITIGKVELRVDDIGNFIYFMKNREFGDKGFYRLSSLHSNICLDRAEYDEVLKYIDDNEMLLVELYEEANDIIVEHLKNV